MMLTQGHKVWGVASVLLAPWFPACSSLPQAGSEQGFGESYAESIIQGHVFKGNRCSEISPF